MNEEYLPLMIKAKAIKAFRNQWGIAVLVALFVGVFELVSNAATTITDIVTKKKEFVEVLGETMVDKVCQFYDKWYVELLIVSLAVNLFITIIQYGYNKIYIDIVRGKDARFSTVFDGFLYPVKAVATEIYVMVLIIMWMFLLIVPGIVAIFKYSMTHYIIAENPDIPITDALDMSKNMMEGHKTEYFMLITSFLPWLLVIVLTFGLASIYVVPYMNTSLAQFYVQVKSEYEVENGEE